MPGIPADVACNHSRPRKSTARRNEGNSSYSYVCINASSSEDHFALPNADRLLAATR